MLVLYVLPPAVEILMRTLDMSPVWIQRGEMLGFASPFSALFGLPLDEQIAPDNPAVNEGNLPVVAGYFVFSSLVVIACTVAMMLRLRSRKGLSDG
jgi:hypothetical protein